MLHQNDPENSLSLNYGMGNYGVCEIRRLINVLNNRSYDECDLFKGS